MRLVVAAGNGHVLGRSQSGGLGLVGAEEPAQLLPPGERRVGQPPDLRGLPGRRRQLGLAPVELGLQPVPLTARRQRGQAGQPRLSNICASGATSTRGAIGAAAEFPQAAPS